LAPWQKNIEPRGQAQRGRKARAELVEQRADVTLELGALAEAEQLERGHEHVGRVRRVAVHARRRGRGIEADDEQAHALRASHERQEQQRARVQPGGEIGRLPVRIHARASESRA
jgi:hypothetical protein